MERTISQSNTTTQGEHVTRERLWWRVVRALFPFLVQPEADRAPPTYDRAGDHLFLPESRSAKDFLYPETLTLGVTLLSVVVGLVALLTLTLGLSPLVSLTGLVALFYASFLLFKFVIVLKALQFPLIDFSRQEIAALSEAELPTYTILVPLLKEAEVAEQIIAALSSIDYPADKIDLLITLEEHDTETRDALLAAGLPDHWRIVTLPDTTPKAKPKSLNVAFKEARGEYLVIYDAEIIPDSDQLKKAVLAFRHHPDIAVMQTRLDHYNTHQSLLTRLFTTEFTFHYDLFLPGLQAYHLPIPLSGHSVHYRTEALREVGAWDSYNVAEDCELGMRLYRHRYTTGMMNSLSREEAAGDLMGWIKQRTRWMKGFIQTSVVHLRYPLALKDELGSWRMFLGFLVLVPGTVLINLLNFGSWFILIAWFATGAGVIQEMYPAPVLYLSGFFAIVGGFAFLYLNLIALYYRGKFDLVRFWPLTPLYWILLSFATARAVWQMRSAASAHTWEKTTHGTHRTIEPIPDPLTT
ncbi:glycosyltransferase [Patescibacteria group bacterium]|jgi:cellulose synthase/poly-beta-1,6-N-acetylglucosamine synthase-like glycosyltransferase|nr:glycosyltransferase [Patescibacteria group bacterium]